MYEWIRIGAIVAAPVCVLSTAERRRGVLSNSTAGWRGRGWIDGVGPESIRWIDRCLEPASVTVLDGGAPASIGGGGGCSESSETEVGECPADAVFREHFDYTAQM